MRVAVVGAGPMGRATVAELFAGPDGGVDSVLVVDRDPARLDALRREFSRRGQPVRTQVGDGADREVKASLAAVDAVATASSWADALAVTEFALQRGIPVTGIGRPPADPRNLLGAAASLAVFGTGLEPGLTEVLAGRLVARSGSPTELRVFCGGVPARPRPPLRHVTWFGPARLPAARATFAVREGRLTPVERFSDVELVTVPGIGTLEAFHDGMLSWLTRDPTFGQLRNIDQKTLRWPGFSAILTTLQSLGLLDETAVDVDGTPVIPRDVIDAVLTPAMARGDDDRDVTVLAVEVGSTPADGANCRGTRVVVRTDPQSGMTGMARLTGAMLAETARRVADVGVPGLAHPWEVFSGRSADSLVERLRRRGIDVVDHDGPWVGRVVERSESL